MSFHNNFRRLTLLPLAALLFTLASGDESYGVLPAVGINAPKRYATVGPIFCNCFKMAGDWKNVSGDAPIDLDERGYVNHLQPSQSVWCPVMPGGYCNPDGGDFVMTWRGKGEVAIDMNRRLGRNRKPVHIVSQSDHRLVFRTEPEQAFCLLVAKVDPADPIRDIKIWMPGLEESNTVYHPAYLKAFEPFGYVRFLDWGDNFTLDVVEWSDRRPGDYASEAMRMGAGGSYESQITLCNELGCDLWICIPHRASDGYVRQCATLIRDTLKPGLRCIVEYSNENWNSSFPVYEWISDQRLPGENHPTAYGRLAGRVMEIFTGVFGDEDRLYRVIGGHVANSWQLQNALRAATQVCTIDAGAVTHYFSDGVSDLIWDRGEAFYTNPSDENLEWAFDHLDRLIREKRYEKFKANKDVCDEYNVDLITYEGGPHLTNRFAKKQTHAMMPFLNAMNAHPRIKQSYAITLDAWKRAGGGAITPYHIAGPWSNWGAWGHLNYIGQPREEAPKYDFLLGYIDSSSESETADTFDRGLVAHWTFESIDGDEVSDASGGGHTATLREEASIKPGKTGDAPELELKIHPPVGSRLTVAPFDIEGGDEHITLAAWIHPYAFGRCAKRQARIIAKTESKGQYMGGTHYWTLTFWEQGLRFALTTDSGRSDAISEPKIVQPNEWAHVAATWDGQTVRVYLNGKVVASEPRDGQLLKAPDVGVCIGNETTYIEGINFQGLIDDVRIYNRALDDRELTHLRTR